MAKDETNFRNRVRDNAKKYFVVMQIESGDTAPGVPDTHFLKRGTNQTLWIELKAKKTMPNKIDLRRSQYIWHRRYAREGGKSFIVVYVSNPNTIIIWRGEFAKELFDGNNIYNLPHFILPSISGKWEKFNQYFLGQVEG